MATKNMFCSQSFFDKFVADLAKKYGSFSPKILWRIFLSEFVSDYFKTRNKKFLLPLSARGRGGSLNGRSVRLSDRIRIYHLLLPGGGYRCRRAQEGCQLLAQPQAKLYKASKDELKYCMSMKF